MTLAGRGRRPRRWLVVRPERRALRRWRGRSAPRFGLVDRPGGHKGHRAPTPLGGGVAIWLTTVSILGAGGAGARPGLGLRCPPPLARHVGGALVAARRARR